MTNHHLYKPTIHPDIQPSNTYNNYIRIITIITVSWNNTTIEAVIITSVT